MDTSVIILFNFRKTMTAVIDVLAMLKEKRLSLIKEQTSIIDYTKKNDHFTVARFIFECGKFLKLNITRMILRFLLNVLYTNLGIKLDMQPQTISTAAYFYHRFLREPGSHKFDPYVSISTYNSICISVEFLFG